MFFEPYVEGNPKCYAHRLGGCSKKLSGEHVFTAAVMGKGAIGVRGFPGIANDRFIGLSSATAKILCVKHNSLLTDLDSEAKKLSDALDQFHAAKVGVFDVVINGPILERWLLKVTMGCLAGGYTGLGKQYASSGEVVGALFGRIPMSSPIGMYSMAGVERRTDVTKEWLFRALEVRDPQGRSHAAGAFVALHGLPFLFYFGGPYPVDDFFIKPDGTSYLDPYDCSTARATFHPGSMSIGDEGTKRLTVMLEWPMASISP